MKQTKGISSQATKPYRRHDVQLRRHTSDTERARAVTGGPRAEGVGHRPPKISPKQSRDCLRAAVEIAIAIADNRAIAVRSAPDV